MPVLASLRGDRATSRHSKFPIPGEGCYSDLDLVARSGGFVLAADAFEIGSPAPEAPRVFLLDAQGRVTGALAVMFPDEKWGGWPSVAVREGRVFVSYFAALSAAADEVRLVELGCPKR